MRLKNVNDSPRKPWAPAIAAASALLLASCSSTDGFKVADTDNSESVSPNEFERYMLEVIYAEADANQNSEITYEEWKAANPETKKSRFSAPDTNSDGAVTPAEAKAHFDRVGTLDDLFAKIDTNNDQSLSRDEVLAFKEKMESLSGTPIQKLSKSASSK